jgi:hypothetical protein
VLTKIEKVTPFIELHKRTGDRHTGCRNAFDVPAFAVAGRLWTAGIKSHRFSVQTKTDAQQGIERPYRDKNYSGNNKGDPKAM